MDIRTEISRLLSRYYLHNHYEDAYALGEKYMSISQPGAALHYYTKGIINDEATNEQKSECFYKIARILYSLETNDPELKRAIDYSITLDPGNCDTWLLFLNHYNNKARWIDLKNLAAYCLTLNLKSRYYSDVNGIFKIYLAIAYYMLGVDTYLAYDLLEDAFNIDNGEVRATALRIGAPMGFRPWSQQWVNNKVYVFPGYEEITNNYSMFFEDTYILFKTNLKRNGIYKEFLGYDPLFHSNTQLLRESYDWTEAAPETLVDYIGIDLRNPNNPWDEIRKYVPELLLMIGQGVSVVDIYGDQIKYEIIKTQEPESLYKGSPKLTWYRRIN